MKPLQDLVEEAIVKGNSEVLANSTDHSHRVRTYYKDYPSMFADKNYSYAKLTLEVVHPYSIYEQEYENAKPEQDKKGRYAISCVISIYPAESDTTGVIYSSFGDFFYYVPTTKTFELARSYPRFPGSRIQTLQHIFAYFYDVCPDFKMEDK
jgi:hypothetical protein